MLYKITFKSLHFPVSQPNHTFSSGGLETHAVVMLRLLSMHGNDDNIRNGPLTHLTLL